MWANLVAEITARILSARTYFNAAIGHPAQLPQTTPPITSPAEPAVKGLMFVLLYAVCEYTVVSIIRAAWIELRNHGTPIAGLRLELLGAVLHPELDSVTKCAKDRTWETRTTLFRKANAADPARPLDSFFPSDGSHFKVSQLRTIWDLFGVTGQLLPRNSLIGLIDFELTEHRNAVAHGRRTAEEVGRAYSVPDVLGKIQDTQDLCLYLVATMQTHCSNPASFAR
jgi:hypothetical protein